MSSEEKFLRKLTAARFLYIQRHPSKKSLELSTPPRFMKIFLPKSGICSVNIQGFLKMSFSGTLKTAKLRLQLKSKIWLSSISPMTHQSIS
jgi:hypothetical protein